MVRSPEIWLAWLPAGRSLLSGLNDLVSRVTFNSSRPWGSRLPDGWQPAGRSPDSRGFWLAAGRSPGPWRSLLSGLNGLVSYITFNRICREISGDLVSLAACRFLVHVSIDKRGNTTTTTKTVLKHYYRAYQKKIEKRYGLYLRKVSLVAVVA